MFLAPPSGKAVLALSDDKFGALIASKPANGPRAALLDFQGIIYTDNFY